MSDAAVNPTDDRHDSTPAIELPIVDYLFFNTSRDAYAVTFVPQDAVSTSEKEVVEIGRATAEGDRLAAALYQISRVIGAEVDRIYHAGGDNFGIYAKGGQLCYVSARSPSTVRDGQIDALLRELAGVAESAFLAERAPTAKTA